MDALRNQVIITLLFIFNISHLYCAEKFLIKNKSGREVYNINKDWEYLQNDIVNINNLSRTKTKWEKINLPHTWNRCDVLDEEPGYRQDAGWYQKNIFIPELSYGQKLILHFDGANITSKIFVNNKYAGEHIGGYVGFDIDITSFVKDGNENNIKVRVDNSYNPNIIPSQKSDFFIYGGLVRSVWLCVLPADYFERCHAIISKVSDASAETKIEANIKCSTGMDAILLAKIIDPHGKIVLHAEAEKKLSKGDNSVLLNFPELMKPELWSPDSPNLYKIELDLMNKNKMVDSVSDEIGYRWYEFKSHGAFYLNGKRVLIKGTCRHEDYAGYGEAIPDSLQWKDIMMMKEMGANFVRLAHYPQSPIVYKACDELGLMVWDELPWCRGGIGGEEWKSNTRRLFNEQINQNFNHPSIIIWSLGNELNWLPDFPNGGNPDSLNTFLHVLNNMAHRMDPSRLTAVRKYEVAAKIVDVYSPSIWAGWYSGVYTSYAKAIEEAQKKYPHLLHMEWGGSSLIGRHSENPITGKGILNPNEWDEKSNKIQVNNIAKMGDKSENYIVDLFDWCLSYTMQTTTFAGNVQWAFKDFPSPLRPENAIPYMNLKGLLDRAGHPKDAYYVFKSYWTKKPSFCYIESHTWTYRSGPKGIKREVRVYSNCDEVELFLNGKSSGEKIKDIKKFPASGLKWEVNFKEGLNKLRAVGYDKGEKVAEDSMKLYYSFGKSGKADHINLSARRMNNGNYMITALVVDLKDRRCLDYNSRIYFSFNGHGRLFDNLGTTTGSSVIEMANGMAQIEFKPALKGQAVICARTQDFQGTFLPINNNSLKDTIWLWNGKKLGGFKFILRNGSVSTKNVYSFKKGSMNFSINQIGYFYTTNSYSNFKLHAEWAWSTDNKRNNSGILLFIQKPDTVWPECIQVNFKRDNAGDLIGMNGAECRETIGKPKETAKKFLHSNEKSIGYWNRCDVISKGDSLMVYINGTLQNKATNLNFNYGRIGFQLEGKPVKFRNIYLVKY